MFAAVLHFVSSIRCLSLFSTFTSHKIRPTWRAALAPAAALAVIACLGAAEARSATFTVTDTSDSGSDTSSLRYALNNLDAGLAVSTNTINVTATGTITLTGPLPGIYSGVTITGPGASLLTISGADAYEVFGIYSGSTVSISGLTIANANPPNAGGGIENVLSTLTVSNCTFSGNASNGGGGIDNYNGTVTVTNSTFSGNSGTFGGGISNSGTMTVANSTFSGNSSPFSGGGIFNSSGTLTVTNSTFFGNTTPGAGGAIQSVSGTLTVTNSIFSGNSAFSSSAAIGNGGIANASYNVYWNNLAQGSEDDCNGCTSNSNAVSATANPLAVPLGNYGGPTQTLLPQSGSVAICAGSASLAVDASSNPLSTDQRGWPMTTSPSLCPSGYVDAGAVQTNYYTVNTLTDSLNASDATSCSDGSESPTNTCSLRDALAQANAAGQADVAFAPALFVSGTPAVATPGTIMLGSGPAGDTALPQITGMLNLTGPGANLLIVSGNYQTSVGNIFTVNSAANAIFYGMTIANGAVTQYPGGAAIYINDGGTATVDADQFTGNIATGTHGGAILNSGTIAILNSTFANNSSTNRGGAFQNGYSGVATLTNSTFFNNQAARGAAIANFGRLTAYNTTLSGNTATGQGNGIGESGPGQGGGIDESSSPATLTLYNSIVAGNAATGGASGADCYNCGSLLGSNNLIGLPNGITNPNQILGSLAYSPANAGVQVMMPLPDTYSSPALGIVCQGSLQSAQAAGIATDQRGFPMDPQCSTGSIDLGAAQTNYTGVQFVQQPPATAALNTTLVPPLAVVVQEANVSTDAVDDVGGIPVAIAFSGTASDLSGTLLQTSAIVGAGSAADNLAIFGDLEVNTVGNYTLTAVTPSLASPAFEMLSNNFTVYDPNAPTYLAFTTPPPPTLFAGGNAGTVTVSEMNGANNVASSASDWIRLFVTYTGNGSWVQYQATASGGVATFDLSAVPLTVAGTYAYSAMVAGNAGIATSNNPTETVTALTTPATLIVSGYPTPIYAGVANAAQITTTDTYGNLVTGYTGPVTVTTSDPAATITGSPVTLANGVGSVSVTFATAGTQTITASAAGLTSVPQAGIAVNPVPQFVVTVATDTTDGPTAYQNCTNQALPGATPDANCSLRNALEAAGNVGLGNVTFSTAVFQAATTISLTPYDGSNFGSLLIYPGTTPGITVTGPTAGSGATLANLVTVSGGGQSSNLSVFQVMPGEAAIVNLNIANGGLSGNDSAGGGIYNMATLSVTGCNFSSNSAAYGAAVLNLGTLIIANSTFANNAAGSAHRGEGGAIYNAGGVANISNSVFTGNSALGTAGHGAGGAIYNAAGAAMTVAGSTFSLNSAGGTTRTAGGGAICNDGSTLTVSDSTFFSNSTASPKASGGGAVLNYNGGTLTVINSTISGNWAAGNQGGGIFNDANKLAMTNSIVDGNWLGAATSQNSYDDLDDLTGNTTFTGGTSDGGGNVLGYYNAFQISPLPGAPPTPAINLATLGNYGGPTQTMIPLPGSPAICAGTATPSGGLSALSTDQRGNSLDAQCPSGSVDAGAVETNYSLAFSTEPSPISPASAIVLGAPFQAGVTLYESGSPFGAASVSIPLTLTSSPTGATLSNGTQSTTNGLASYSTLQVNQAGTGDTLTASLTLNGGLTPPLVLSAASQSFAVDLIPTSFTFAPSPASQVYGTPIAAGSLDASGPAPLFSANMGGTFAYTTPVNGAPTTLSAGTTVLPAGSYVITATFSPSESQDFAASSETASYTVTPASPTLALACAAATYNGNAHSCTGSATGVGGAAVTGTWIFSPASETAAGSYPVTGTFTSSDPNYASGGTAGGALVIGTGSLSVTANNASKVYGTPNPAFTGSITGALSSDTFAESFSTTATLNSNVGTYSIVPAAVGADLSDYSVTIQNGKLTITQAASTTSLSASSGSANPGQSVTLTAKVASATTGTPTGSVSFYDGSTLLNTTTLSAGTATLSTSSLSAGATHQLTAVYGGDTNFANSSTTASIPVIVAALDFSLSATSASQTVNPGSAATYSVVVNPLYGTYPGAVSFAVSGLPSGASATFSPSSIATNGGQQTVTVTVQTVAAAASLQSNPLPSAARRMQPFALAFVLLLGVGCMRRRRLELRRIFFVVLLLMAGAATLMGGCGGHSSSTSTPETYNLTVTASSGTVQHTASVTLTVE